MRRIPVLVLAAVAAALLVEGGVVLAGESPSGSAVRLPQSQVHASGKAIVGHAVAHYRTPALRTIRPAPYTWRSDHEAARNLLLPAGRRHVEDPVVQRTPARPNMPSPILNFDGIAFPGVACNCAPPDTNGEVGSTQYVQIVNQGFEVWNKTTGAHVLGPLNIATVWPSGICRTAAHGDPVVLYDQLAGRWLLSQFAGAGTPTDECVALSDTDDATGTWIAWDFHLGTDFFDYPHLGVWPDGYYLSENVFDSSGSDFLGTQPIALERPAMLAGRANPRFVTFRRPPWFTPGADPFLPADVDGSTPPPAGAPNPFLVEGVISPTWKLYRFHVDWSNVNNSSFTLADYLTPAPFSPLCPATRACVPQQGSADTLDALADRGMFRNAYRNFGNGHEALVGNMSVSSGGVAGIRWWELSHVTSGTPAFVQQSTYQPDTSWRWMGSAAMDHNGDVGLGFSKSSATMHPAIWYAGRLVTDPAGQLAQGETQLFQGAGSQEDTVNRWGDYSDLTVDPEDDCTFWYTQEYYASTSSFNWRTRIGNFKFPGCGPVQLSLTNAADAATVGSGGQMGFTVSLSNTGVSPATGLAAGDALPGGSGVGWAIDAAASSPGWSIVGSPPNQSLAFGETTLLPGAQTHVHVVSGTSQSGCGSYASTASYTADTSVSGQASASVTVSCPPPPPPPPSPPPPPPPPPPFTPPKCVVPNVLHLRLAKARARIRRRHCKVGTVTRKRSSRANRGRVIRQAPRGSGRKRPAGFRVRLTVGK